MNEYTGDRLSLDQTQGSLTLHTGVTGRASRMGHRLTIVMNEWRGEVAFEAGQPTAVEFRVAVTSLEVTGGQGGVKSLSGPEKSLARSNALGSLAADDFPEITFVSQEITATEPGFALNGVLTIHGVAQDRVVDLIVTEDDEQWQLEARATVRQSDFGVSPYSLMMGALGVADDVDVAFAASVPKGS